MTFGVPEETASPIPLMQPEAPFLLGMRAFDAMREFQMEWWRAWCGLLGQVAPADPALEAEVAAEAEEAKTAETSPPEVETSKAA